MSETPKDTAAEDRSHECEERVIAKLHGHAMAESFAAFLRSRRDFGRLKYGATMDRGDKSLTYWIQMALEEQADGVNYLQRCIDLEQSTGMRAVWESRQSHAIGTALMLLDRLISLQEGGGPPEDDKTLLPSQPSTLNRRPGA